MDYCVQAIHTVTKVCEMGPFGSSTSLDTNNPKTSAYRHTSEAMKATLLFEQSGAKKNVKVWLGFAKASNPAPALC